MLRVCSKRYYVVAFLEAEFRRYIYIFIVILMSIEGSYIRKTGKAA